jgi:iron complex transport system permease protein
MGEKNMVPFLANNRHKVYGLLLCILLFSLAFIASIVFGTTKISFTEAYQSFISYDENNLQHVIVLTTRLPRAVIATVIGCSLAVAGVLMQAITRNPLASPSILGINTGAVFFIVLASAILPLNSMVQYMWVAFLGAAISTFFVYFLGSIGRDGITPIKLILAGSAISALFLSGTQAILVLNQKGLQEVLFWLTGSVSGRTLEMLFPVLPFMVLALGIAIFIAKDINLMLSGEDVAKSLGVRTGVLKIVIGIVVIFLAGGSVAVAGAVGFIGLIIPHIGRFFVGADHHWLIPFSAILGAILVLLADVFARFIIMPAEVPIGVMTAIVGVPFFIYIARRGVLST